MKQGRMPGIVLAAVNVILLALCAILYLQTDRTSPKMEFQESQAVYREKGNKDRLLEGVRAVDNADGDITDRIVIEKIVEDRENQSVVVYYAVSDSAGNVAKASRVFDAVFEEQKEETERLMKAGIEAEMSLPEKIETIKKDDRTEEDPAEIESTSTPFPTETPEKTPEPAAIEAPSPEPAQESVPAADPSVPILTLKASEVRVKAGQGPAWVELIGTLSDDKDSYETLFRNLTVSKYDRDRTGSYGVSVYTEDSDGNRSASVPLTIIVE